VTTPGRQGRFDGYDVLGQAGHWDPVTRRVVEERLAAPGPLRFFSAEEAAVAGPLLDLLLGQDDEPRVPLLADVDARLADDVTDGWHHASLPRDAEAWRRSLRHLDEDCQERFGCAFTDASDSCRMALVQAVQQRDQDAWHGLPARHVWSLWMRYACSAFYAHPWAWNEIGFGGPAYPRGYKALGLDRREPWERPERDAHDPVPWADRTERARRRHLDALGRRT
jgi:hypothetical protein